MLPDPSHRIIQQMLARLQQVTTVLLFGSALALMIYFLGHDKPVWALAGATLIVFGYTFILALETALAAALNRTDAAPRASLGQMLCAWLGEVAVAPKVFCWRQPFRSHSEADSFPQRPAGQTGVVFVHGFLCNRGFWNPWMRRLREKRVPFMAVDLEPIFGSISDYAPTIEAAVRRIEAATGARPVLVAHSMGGLAVRAWLAAHGADARINRAVTIGTPHHGTLLARFALAPNAREMRPGSAWQVSLAQHEPPQRYKLFTCFYSHCDNIALPASTATLPGADNRHLSGVAHVELAFDEAVFQEVLQLVAPAAACRH